MAQINEIIVSLEQQLQAVERALEALRSVSGVTGSGTQAARRRGRPRKTAAAPMKKRHLSPEGRRRIIEATKRRWAAVRKAQRQAVKKRGGMTAAGRKRLSELMKARWASKNPPKPVTRKRAMA